MECHNSILSCAEVSITIWQTDNAKELATQDAATETTRDLKFGKQTLKVGKLSAPKISLHTF